MEKLLEAALGVEKPWGVREVKFDASLKRLDIWLKFERGSRFSVAPEEGEAGEEGVLHDTEPKTWRHLNFFEHECHLHAQVPRIRLPDGRLRTVMPPWSGKLNGFTLLFEAFLLALCKHMPVHQVSKMVGISNHKLWRMIDLYVEKARENLDWKDIHAIGIDETSVAKGQDYITLVADLEERKTLFATPGKDHKTVEKFTEELKEKKGLPENIKNASCDMSPAFIKGIRENLPEAQITFDKFHVLKILNEAVDAVRRAESKTNPLLKGTRYLFLKNESNLTEKQRTKKRALAMADLNLDAMRALQIRETFQQIYTADSIQTFTENLKTWVDVATNSGLEPIKKAAGTILRHWGGIVSWKQYQINNGILEGLNSVVQAAKRKARGYKPKHFITIAYLLTAKLDFKPVNKFA